MTIIQLIWNAKHSATNKNYPLMFRPVIFKQITIAYSTNSCKIDLGLHSM